MNSPQVAARAVSSGQKPPIQGISPSPGRNTDSSQKSPGRAASGAGGGGTSRNVGSRVGPTHHLSQSKKSDITLPPKRFKYKLKLENYAAKVSDESSVFMAAVLEYLLAELLDLSVNACFKEGRRKIQPRHILQGLKTDKEFGPIMKNIHIRKGGSCPPDELRA